ncbi:MAG: CapA family protein [Oscillospiraceae bacterium]|nr:CapA family protein [Oscillospiraceae bacterium]
MKLTILGDIMAEIPVLRAAKCRCGKYDFSGVFDPSRKLLAESDYIIGNLETPLAGEEATYSQNHVCFNAPDEYVDAIMDAGIKLVSTVNNHSFDRGYAGMERTIKVLDEKGLPHTGTYLPGTERQEAYYFEQDGTKFAVIAYTYGTNYGGSGGKYLAEGEYEGTVNLLCHQTRSTYMPGVWREDWMERLLENSKLIKDPNGFYKLKKYMGLTATYPRHDDNLDGKTDTPYIVQMQSDIRKAKEKADIVLFYPHVGGQFTIKPGAFTEYVIEKALEAGADAIAATHCHIPEKFEWKNGVPVSYCLGNFNMNPKSYLAMPEILTNYGYALHLYVENKKIVKVTCSMMKNCVMPGGQIASCPVDELYAQASEKEKKALEKDIRHLYGRITGKVLKENIVRREYEL